MAQLKMPLVISDWELGGSGCKTCITQGPELFQGKFQMNLYLAIFLNTPVSYFKT